MRQTFRSLIEGTMVSTFMDKIANAKMGDCKMIKKDADEALQNNDITDKEYNAIITAVEDKRKELTNSVSESAEPINEEVKASLQTIVDAVIAAGNVTQTAHWNLRSKAFVAIHPWFGETYDELFDIADAVAEQIKIADIDLMVNVNRGTTVVATDEQELFGMVLDALKKVEATLDMAAADSSLSRTLQNLIDGWNAQIGKMIWFVKSSMK